MDGGVEVREGGRTRALQKKNNISSSSLIILNFRFKTSKI